MQQRSEKLASIDDFPTPPWAVRALCEYLRDKMGEPLSSRTVREPAANRGYMVRALAESFRSVDASDIMDYGQGYVQRDYIWELDTDWAKVDWTITNPPFTLAQRFVERGLETSSIGVAVIVRSAFLEGIERYSSLFSVRKPALVLQHVERVPMVKGRYDPNVASATAYSWVVWLKAPHGPTVFDWIPPCRKRLERESDAA